MKLTGGTKLNGFKTVYALMICILSASTASAQRTMNGQDYISASIHYSFSGEIPLGADLWWGRYLMYGNAKAGVSYSPFSKQIFSDETAMSRAIQNYTILAHGEYMHRIVATRGRHVGLYAGGGVFLGCELYDPQNRVPSYIDTGLGDWGFLYGLSAALELELFVSRQTCILIRCAVPVNFSSPLSKVRVNSGIGARVNLF